MQEENHSSNLTNAYNQQYTDSMTAWRQINGKGKVENIKYVTRGFEFSSVIEVGAGEGSILYWLEKYQFSPQLSALEISESGIDQIKKRNLSTLQEIRQFDGYHIPYDDNTFDLAVCSHVIEHVEAPRYLLREIKRISKYQVFEIPIDFSFNVDRKIDLFLSYGHINIYYPALFRFLLQSEGFEVITDKASLYSSEVRQAYHAKMKNKLNKHQYRSFWIREQLKLLLWRVAPTRIKSIRPQTYTVMCRKTNRSLEIM